MGYSLQNLCQTETRRLLLVMGMVVATILVIQSFELPYGNVLSSLFPARKNSVLGKHHPMLENVKNPKDGSPSEKASGLEGSKDSFSTENASELVNIHEKGTEMTQENSGISSSPFASPSPALQPTVSSTNIISPEKLVTNATIREVPDNSNTSSGSAIEKVREPEGPEHSFSAKQTMKLDNGFLSDNFHKEGSGLTGTRGGSSDTSFSIPFPALPPALSSTNRTSTEKLDTKPITLEMSVNSNISLVDKHPTGILQKDEKSGENSPTASNKNPQTRSNPSAEKMRSEKLSKSVISISQMNQLLLQNRASSQSMSPRWSSIRDQELLSAKLQIENAPIIKNDRELYGPLFRNISMFKRSYELMERILKVYVYKEGEKPIFHHPLPVLSGIYASEGWFMRLMEENKHFVVKDPKNAHLFYLPFSSRNLQRALYVQNSHNRKKLVEHLKNYLDTIAAKYPFWNRTVGGDHFLVPCHDWGPFETRLFMASCIRALCNADASRDFHIGKDVSLPTTYVRFPKNPLKYLGGNPPSKRTILAFFAGSMHGYLRPILLHYWENKDPDMKIFGPMGHSSTSKMDYIQYMKSSKYCICAKGYEVNSPRVVEAIFSECVPVIISDNYVPPLFEVLNWEAFAVFVAEKDIPNLKNILLSIPEKRYRSMQLRVKKVQRHFLWHTQPVKYDIFHMILHSIWYNRVFQTRSN